MDVLAGHHFAANNVRLSPLFVNVFIPTTAAVAIIFAIILWLRVAKIKVRPSDGHQPAENGREFLLEEESRGEAEVILLCLVDSPTAVAIICHASTPHSPCHMWDAGGMRYCCAIGDHSQ